MNRIVLDDLIGHKLTSVTFIHDYVQMGFEDDWGLSIFNPLRLANQGMEIDDTQHGFKDSLCSLIERSVSHIDYAHGKSVSFIFDNHATMSIRLMENDYTGPEALVLTSASKRDSILVIRAGE